MSVFDVKAAAQGARRAARRLAAADTAAKNAALHGMARRIEEQADAIVRENQRDLEAAQGRGMSSAMLDRLRLTEDRVRAMAEGVREVAALPDPIGQMDAIVRRPSGIEVGRMRIPLGVIAIVYESRPNVTIDAAALTLKSGNAVVLKGGSEAICSNRALARLCNEALAEVGLPEESVVFIDSTDRDAVGSLIQLAGIIDLVIPRGGEGLIRYVTEHARVPVIQHFKGVCHLFVDRDADLSRAVDVVVNAKAQRPGVCNALETLLVDAPVAEAFLTRVGPALRAHGVELRGDAHTCAILSECVPARSTDWGTEFGDLILAVRVVRDMDEAIEHIEAYGSEHTDGILTENLSRARVFVRRVQSSCVVVNASTRFNDGNQLGLGAEIGISTSRLHAFGPMGLVELTTRKFVVIGDGQVRH